MLKAASSKTALRFHNVNALQKSMCELPTTRFILRSCREMFFALPVRFRTPHVFLTFCGERLWFHKVPLETDF